MKYSRKKVFLIVLIIIIVCLAILLPLLDGIQFYEKKITLTKMDLDRARSGVQWFKEQTGELPDSLNDIVAYAKNQKAEEKLTLPFKEYLTSSFLGN